MFARVGHHHRRFPTLWPLLGTLVGVLLALVPVVVQGQTIEHQGTVSVNATVSAIRPGETLVVTPNGAVPLPMPVASPRASVVPQRPDDRPPSASPVPDTQEPGDVTTVLTPSLSIGPAPGQSAVSRTVRDENGLERLVPLFSTNRPRFSGQTNIPQADVTIEIPGSILIRGRTYTDTEGGFEWVSPAFEQPGLYTATVTVTDPSLPSLRVTQTFDFYLDFTPEARGGSVPRSRLRTVEDRPIDDPLFDVLVQIPSRYKSIRPGDEVIAGVKLLNFGFAGRAVDVPVEYAVEDARGNVVSASSETVAVSTQISLLKTFTTAPNTPLGEYTITVQVPSRGMTAFSSDTFRVGDGSFAAGALRGVADSLALGSMIGSGQGPSSTRINVLLTTFLFFGLYVYSAYTKISTLSLVGRMPAPVSERDLVHYVNGTP